MRDRNGNPLPGPQGGDDPGVRRALAIAAGRDDAEARYLRDRHAGPVQAAGYPWTEFARPRRGGDRLPQHEVTDKAERAVQGLP